MTQSQAPWQIEQANREHYRQTNPKLLDLPVVRASQQEAAVGIGNLPPDRPAACWRLYPADYLIEELGRTGRSTLSLPAAAVPETGQPWLRGKLLLHDQPTAAAIGFLAQALALEPKQIGVAGRREAGCLGAQMISLPADSAPALRNLAWPAGILAGDWQGSDTPVGPADLSGNGFTAVLRTEAPVTVETFALRLDILAKYGALNHFPLTRFGPRTNYQELGRLALAGSFEAAVKNFLCQTSPAESLLVTRLREVAAASYPNYEKLAKIYQVLPLTFSGELKLIEYLRERPNDYAGALRAEGQQTRQWLFAYGAWLFNRRLTAVSEKNGITTEQLPWPLSSDPLDVRAYQPWLDSDEVGRLETNELLAALLPLKRQLLPGRFFPRRFLARSFTGGLALAFELAGNQPAPTLLANLFDLAAGSPPPDWAEQGKVDAKRLAGQGDLDRVLAALTKQPDNLDNA